MEKKPYYFNQSGVEVSRNSLPRKYSCFYLLSPDKIYLFFLSKDTSNDVLFAPFLGAIDGLFKGLFDYWTERKINIKKAEDFPELNNLPPKLKEKIPSFNRLRIISKESIARIRFNVGDLVIRLKNGRVYRIILFPNNIKRVRSYLRFTNWL